MVRAISSLTMDIMKSFEMLMKRSPILLDGAMGTMLQKAGLKLGERPETLSITSPEAVTARWEQI